MGNPEQAVSLHLAHSGSQSQQGIWFILPAHGACHIIKINIYMIHISEKAMFLKTGVYLSIYLSIYICIYIYIYIYVYMYLTNKKA